jgi:hypothetical protein
LAGAAAIVSAPAGAAAVFVRFAPIFVPEAFFVVAMSLLLFFAPAQYIRRSMVLGATVSLSHFRFAPPNARTIDYRFPGVNPAERR